MNWTTNITARLLPAGALFSLLALAADIPQSLPAGFLEQLPALMQIPDEEYEALLHFVAQEQNQPSPAPTDTRREEDNHAD